MNWRRVVLLKHLRSPQTQDFVGEGLVLYHRSFFITPAQARVGRSPQEGNHQDRVAGLFRKKLCPAFNRGNEFGLITDRFSDSSINKRVRPSIVLSLLHSKLSGTIEYKVFCDKVSDGKVQTEVLGVVGLSWLTVGVTAALKPLIDADGMPTTVNFQSRQTGRQPSHLPFLAKPNQPNSSPFRLKTRDRFPSNRKSIHHAWTSQPVGGRGGVQLR